MPRADATRNRAAVLRAAAELVAEAQAADEVTMEAVAHRAGVGKGTVFRAFGSREALLVELFEHLGADHFARDRANGATGDPAARLRALLGEILAAKQRYPVLFEALERTGRAPRSTEAYGRWRAPILAALRDGGRADVADYLADLLLGAVRTDVLRGHSPTVVQRGLDAVVAGLDLRPTSSAD